MDAGKPHWDKIYDEKSPMEVSWFQQDPARSLALIHASGIPREAGIIDVGGGASRLVDALLDEGYTDLSVLDIAAGALAHARERLGEGAAQVNWIEADITRFMPERRYSLWHDRAVFHFLCAEQDRAAYFRAVDRALPVGGHLVIATFAEDGPERCSGLPIVRYSFSTLQSTVGAAYRLLWTEREAHMTPSGKVQHFIYCRFQKR